MHDDLQKLWPEAWIDTHNSGSFTSSSFVKAVAATLVQEVRDEMQLQGWAVMVMDTGGGRTGMHLSLELAILLHKHQIELFLLKPYTTKAFMLLDREPHSEMSCVWGGLRSTYHLTHGAPVSGLREAQ